MHIASFSNKLPPHLNHFEHKAFHKAARAPSSILASPVGSRAHTHGPHSAAVQPRAFCQRSGSLAVSTASASNLATQRFSFLMMVWLSSEDGPTPVDLL